MELKGQVKAQGVFHVEVVRDGKVIHKETIKNMVTNEGKDLMINVMFNGSPVASGTWYEGLLDNGGLLIGDTIDNKSWTEIVAYTEGTRPIWDETTASGGSNSSVGASVFSMNGTVTVYGIFVINVATKSDVVNGELWATALFAAAISVVSGDTINVTYGVSL